MIVYMPKINSNMPIAVLDVTAGTVQCDYLVEKKTPLFYDKFKFYSCTTEIRRFNLT